MKKTKKRKSDVNKKLENLKMNEDVFKLRRNVIELVYEAKNLVPSLPRITVRITEKSFKVNGIGRLNECIVWIPSNSASRTKDQLRRTVFHEILHAAYGIEHVEGCELMGPIFIEAKKENLEKLFVKYANQTKGE